MQTLRTPAPGLAILLTSCLALLACGDDSGTVAKVDGQRITTEDLRRFVLTLPPGLRTALPGDEARADYLQTLIDRELMQLEARQRGLWESPAVLGEVQRKVEERVLGLYRQRELYRDLQVSPEQVEGYIADAGLDVQRLAEGIRVDSEPEAWQLLRDLEGGRAFGELAREHSTDLASAQRGGLLGYLNRVTAARAGIPAVVFDSLQVREVSTPLQLGQGWQVVRFLEDRNEIDPAVRTGVHSRLMKEQRLEAEDERVELLAEELGWHVDDAGLAVLQAMVDGTQSGHLSTAQRQAPVFRFDGGGVSVEQYLAALTVHRVNTTRALSERDFIISVGRRFLRNRAMLLVAAARAGIPEEPEVVRWAEQIHTDLVLQALRQAVVAPAETLATDALLTQYFDKRRDNFRVPERVCFDEILLHDGEEATLVMAEINDNTPLLQLSRERGYHIRRRNADGLVCMKELSARVLPEFWSALQAAPMERLQGPVRLEEEAWVVFKVLHRDPARLQTFDEARRQVHASVLARLERELFDGWLVQVRDSYDSRISVDTEVLRQALPDALLATAPGDGKT